MSVPLAPRTSSLAGRRSPAARRDGAVRASASDASRPLLVGREHECAEIARKIDAARRRESSALVLRGEAGMGKTSLLAYAAAEASEMTVVRATGVEGESELAFAGLHGILRTIVDHLEHVPGPQREALAAALGLAAGEGRDRFLVSAGVLSLLASAAEVKPILCVIDDAQWLDIPSANALCFTARRLVAEGIVMLFGVREGETRQFDATGLDDLWIAALDPDAAATLLDRSAPDADGAVRSRLLVEAAGNPLALLELPAGLSKAQLMGQSALPEALPLTARLRAAFGERVELLPPAARNALLLAAAHDDGEIAVLARAAAQLDLPPDAFEPAANTGLVQVDKRTLTFRHPLVRSVVYDSAPVSHRQRAHAALAAALEDPADLDRAVWHRAMAAAGPDEEIAEELEASAARSRARGGQASAVVALERAAKLSGSDSSRSARLTEAVEAAWFAGQVDQTRDLVDRALPRASRAQRALLLFRRGVVDGQSGWLLDGVAAMQQAMALSDDASLTLKILREGCAMAAQAGAHEQALEFARRAADVPTENPIDRLTATALGARTADLTGDFKRGRTLSAEVVEMAERVDDPACLIWAALAASRAGGPGAGLPLANRAVSMTRERGMLTTLPFALQVQAAALIGHSRFDLAYASAEEGWRLAIEARQPWAAAWNVVNLALVDALRGAEDRVHDRLAALREQVERSGASSLGGYTHRVLGLLYLGLGRPDEALERFLSMLSTIRSESNPPLILVFPDALEAAVRAGRLDTVVDHIKGYEDWVERFPSPAGRALAARCRALTGRSGAEHYFADACRLADALPPFERARTELVYGEWLRRRRRRVDARHHLNTAIEIFRGLALRPWEARARSELRASGLTARSPGPITRDQLTPQELQISHLVAGGMTNPQVAGQLFLSPRTIDYHLRKVFAKLEIASRADLAAIDFGDPASG